MLSPALMSSVRPDWQTPDCVLDRVREVAPIGLDPCTTAENPVQAPVFYTPEDNGLLMPWEIWSDEEALVYCNPPYGRGIGPWVQKCSSTLLTTVIALLPARTDTRWFPWDADALCFWQGRLRFRGAPAPAPFPSVVALWAAVQSDIGRFEAAFDTAGKVVRL